MTIHEAKNAKKLLIEAMARDLPHIKYKINIIFHNKELALQITLKEKLDLVKIYHGFPLLVKEEVVNGKAE